MNSTDELEPNTTATNQLISLSTWRRQAGKSEEEKKNKNWILCVPELNYACTLSSARVPYVACVEWHRSGMFHSWLHTYSLTYLLTQPPSIHPSTRINQPTHYKSQYCKILEILEQLKLNFSIKPRGTICGWHGKTRILSVFDFLGDFYGFSADRFFQL